MKFIPASLNGVYVMEVNRLEDERGFFARSFCADEFRNRGFGSRIAQCNISFNRLRGTLRGMHYQVSPKAEEKLVRCTRGSIFDVVIDLREDSATYLKWESFLIDAQSQRSLYIPAGCAHGFQTLEDNVEVFYQISEFYSADHARGILWNDPAFRILWPIADPVMSEKDRSYPLSNI
jgi:dTDP-4-dehydrorhamnose 3,5-epimerase